jgi:hypothetical protein
VAQMDVRAMSLAIRPPRNRGRHGDSIRLNIVAAIESQPPEGKVNSSQPAAATGFGRRRRWARAWWRSTAC